MGESPNLAQQAPTRNKIRVGATVNHFEMYRQVEMSRNQITYLRGCLLFFDLPDIFLHTNDSIPIVTLSSYRFFIRRETAIEARKDLVVLFKDEAIKLIKRNKQAYENNH